MGSTIFLISIVIIICLSAKSRILLIDLWKSRSLLVDLALNDLRTKYAGSYLGLLWAFIQPILTTFIYWFVFQIGFRAAPVDDFPFILWLITGLVPWFFFNEAVVTATSSMLEYSYLVKKVMFNINIIPAVKIISGLFIHCVFLIFVFFVYVLMGKSITIYAVQVLYYSFCLLVLVVGVVYITATINVFIKDTLQAISVFLQLLFWMTPIVWDMQLMPLFVQNILQFNPLCYIVMGYRDALINNIWFWEKPVLTTSFWLFTAAILFVGVNLFGKMKKHFSDVL